MTTIPDPIGPPPMPGSILGAGSPIEAREGRLVVGVYRRQMKVIRYLGELDRLFGVPVSTRSWSTLAAIATVLKRRD